MSSATRHHFQLRRTKIISVAFGCIFAQQVAEAADSSLFLFEDFATAIQDKKDSGLDQQRLFRIDHAVHGKFPIRHGCKRSLCTLAGKQDGPHGLPGSLQKQDPQNYH